MRLEKTSNLYILFQTHMFLHVKSVLVFRYGKQLQLGWDIHDLSISSDILLIFGEFGLPRPQILYVLLPFDVDLASSDAYLEK